MTPIGGSSKGSIRGGSIIARQRAMEERDAARKDLADAQQKIADLEDNSADPAASQAGHDRGERPVDWGEPRITRISRI
jgi:hypothetical protein